jgi:hypothetical protein
MKHLEFQREFLTVRLQTVSPFVRRLWRWQFRFIHRITAAVVAWDHRRCLRVHGMNQATFRRRAAAAWSRFVRRLEHMAQANPACHAAGDEGRNRPAPGTAIR